MKAKFGSIVVDGRGKLGGHVYSKNRAGAYVRTKVTPVNPQTASQSAVRGFLTSLSQGWRALTETQRTGWNAAVENFKKTDIFGDLKSPSGLNLFVRLNSNLLNTGNATIDDAPSLSTSPAYVAFTSAPDSSPQTLSLAWSSGAVPANTTWLVEATAPQSPGKSFVKNQFRIIKTIAAAAASPNNALAAYQAKFGDLIGGQKVGIRIRAIDEVTGVAGPLSTQLYITL